MIKTLLAIIIFTGACGAYPRNDESALEPHIEVLESNPEDINRPPPDDPLKPPSVDLVAPESDSFPADSGPALAQASEDITADEQDGYKQGTDLKTDATFWWPYYKSYWGYPHYKTYWSYPSYYSYYSPRTYYKYKYYYW